MTTLRTPAIFVAMVSLLAGGAQQASAATNYIPSTITLANAGNRTLGKVCVIGTSQSTQPPAIAIPSFYLASNGAKAGVWTQTSSSTQSVTALELGKDITSILMTPSGPANSAYVNAGSVRFYYLKNGSPGCSSIVYAYTNPSAGVVIVPAYPYPSALLELSSYPSGNNNVLTIDTSNVDTFQLPLQMAVSNGATVLATIGNPVAPASVFNRRTMITGPNNDGRGSPFITWLQAQPGYQSGPNLFAPLLLGSSAWRPPNYPFASLQSPADFLAYKCVANAPFQCPLSGTQINRSNPLATYFDQELAAFFQNAMGLIVMGDGVKSIPQAAWTVTATDADCPAYLRADHQSLRFTAGTNTPSITLCNPLGTVVPLIGQPTAYRQQGSDASVVISNAQYLANSGRVGWNFGQPESGWIAKVTGFTPLASPQGAYRLNLRVLATPAASLDETFCKGAQCPMANPSFQTWVFSNIQNGTSTNPFERPTQMVFANDGAFSSWLYESNTDRMKVTQSIERNIVWAFNHGIANCNNLTMATPPAACTGIVALKSSKYVAGAAAASDAYWANEANWYPPGGTQNYYAQYLHTAQLDSNGNIASPAACAAGKSCFNIFAAPNGSLVAPATSAQGIAMGMAYGFAYDEGPDYLTIKAAPVPSKLDPIPTAWGTGLSVTVTVGEGH